MSNSIDKLTPTVFLDRKLILYLLNERKHTPISCRVESTNQDGRLAQSGGGAGRKGGSCVESFTDQLFRQPVRDVTVLTCRAHRAYAVTAISR